ncbi:MAG TPA: metallophosphatase [Opitutae bacterium]|nr:metallophosphatase [Opitutae bacterium]
MIQFLFFKRLSRLISGCACAFLIGSCTSDGPDIIIRKAKEKAKADLTVRKEVRTIAFGSCADPNLPMPVLNVSIDQKADLFIWLGDNIYGNTQDIEALNSDYEALGSHENFKKLAEKTRLLATWDDRDYGWNDAGRHYPLKEASKEAFLSFWEEPPSSPRRSRPGIYMSYLFDGGRTDVHIILLDTRSFRSDLKRASGVAFQGTNDIAYAADYVPHTHADSTLLGDSQWRWLEKQFEVRADVRIIGSSTQFGIEWNGYESWANFPHEQERIAEIIRKSNSLNRQRDQQEVPVLFISGDVHYGEISGWQSSQKAFDSVGDTLFDITSSGINSSWDFATPNANRIEGPLMENNIGILRIGRPRQPFIVAELWDDQGQKRISRNLSAPK